MTGNIMGGSRALRYSPHCWPGDFRVTSMDARLLFSRSPSNYLRRFNRFIRIMNETLAGSFLFTTGIAEILLLCGYSRIIVFFFQVEQVIVRIVNLKVYRVDIIFGK